jgi:hypothetical protein
MARTGKQKKQKKAKKKFPRENIYVKRAKVPKNDTTQHKKTIKPQ